MHLVHRLGTILFFKLSVVSHGEKLKSFTSNTAYFVTLGLVEVRVHPLLQPFWIPYSALFSSQSVPITKSKEITNKKLKEISDGMKEWNCDGVHTSDVAILSVCSHFCSSTVCCIITITKGSATKNECAQIS